MTATIAIKSFLEKGPNGRTVDAKELLALKKSCTDAEWKELAEQAAKELGVKLDAEKPRQVVAVAGL